MHYPTPLFPIIVAKLLGGGGGGGGSVTPALVNALLDWCAHSAFTDNQGQTYYDNLKEALYPVASIAAVYTQTGTVYDTDSLNSLKADLVVTATYEDGTSATVPYALYTLSGTLAVGTSTITVTYKDKTATFDVTVTAAPVVESISAVYTQSGTVYNTDALDTLKNNLDVTATYEGGATEVIDAANYTLSGTLKAGTSVITATFGGKTDTFDVFVTQTGYTFYDYLERTSENYDYVETNLVQSPSFAVLDCDMRFSMASESSANGAICGCRTTGSSAANKNEYAFYGGSQTNGAAIRSTTFGTPVQDVGVFSASAVRNVSYRFNAGNAYIIVDNGEPVYLTNAVPSASIPSQTTYPLFLCAVNNGGSGDATTAKVVWVKNGRIAYTNPENGNLVYEFIPAYNGTKYGYYETVNGVFYPQKNSILVGGNNW